MLKQLDILGDDAEAASAKPAQSALAAAQCASVVRGGPVTATVVDLFAGPGGWDEGLHSIGVTDVIGIEIDKNACATAEKAGHKRLRADIAAVDTAMFVAEMRHLVGSPPCTMFSMAGTGHGRLMLGLLSGGIRAMFRGDDRREEIRAAAYETCLAERASANGKRKPEDRQPPEQVEAAARDDAACITLVLEPARFIADAIRCGGPLESVALEQVPSVSPLWKAYAQCLREIGWSAWAGVLNSADYGVPQTRERAILIARRHGAAFPPAPTHAKDPQGADLFGGELLPWVSMADALGWPENLEVISNYNTGGESGNPGRRPATAPSVTLTSKADRMKIVLRASDRENATARDLKEPAPTILCSRPGNLSWVLDRRQNSRGPRGTTVPSAPVPIDRPAPTVTGLSGGQWVLRNGTQANACSRTPDEPAGTLFFGSRLNNVSWTDGEATVRLTVEEAAILQSFPADYPWQGTKSSQFLQVGNAVPPRLAAAVAEAAFQP